MVDTIKKSFRATSGLDAAGEKVINVATADRTVLTDGVNVEYFFQENTIQEYKTDRAYIKGFAVIHNNKIWISQVDIAEPSGTFNEGQWKPVRVDPKWALIQGGTRTLLAGEYLTVDSSLNNPIAFTLPTESIDGDTIVIRDIGGRVGYTSVSVTASSQSIRHKGVSVRDYQMTVPYSELVFVYNNRLWNLFAQAPEESISTATTATPFDAQAGQTILRRYLQLSPITIRLPKHANHGDIIQFVGMDHPTVPYYHCIINTFDDNTSVYSPGQKSLEVKYALNGYFIFNSDNQTWGLYDGNVQDRLRTVGADTNLFPGETVSVVGKDNTTVQTITLTLPTNVQPGDQITVALNYMRKGQTVRIVPGGTDKILTDQNMMQFPKRSSYPPNGNWVSSTELVFNGTTSYPPIVTFAYIPMGPTLSQWMVVENVPQLERVDPTTDATRGRLGLTALATQAQANLDKENISTTLNAIAREVVLTPETLASRVALETRRGIARIATTPEVNQASTATYLDDVIVTPKKLNERVATEDMRGLAEIVSGTEVLDNTNDTHIITPKKLDVRRATEGLTGVAFVVVKGGAPSTTRAGNGTGVFDTTDHSKIVTPLVLGEYKATLNQIGAGFLASSAEVIAGTANPAQGPLFVTPVELHKKTATESRIGFAEIATQAETDAGTDDLRFVTPKKLAGRIAKEDQTGVSRVATQPEFDAGVLDNVISTPLKIKTRFNDPARISVSANSGLTGAGTLWDHYTLDILEATENQRGTLLVATQAITDQGVSDNTIITPKKLQAKKATTTAEGIVRIANTAETNTGVSPITAVCPLNLKNVIQVEKSWEASVQTRGPVKMTEGALTFVGNDTVGNTQNLDLYQKSGYAISPYELNKTLANYAPLKSKAVDSDKLDGLDSTQFVRNDIDQTVNGSITLTNNLVNTANSDLQGTLTIGKLTTVRDIVYPKVFLRAHTGNAGMAIGTKMETSGLVKFVFGYTGNFQTSSENNSIASPAFEFSHAGNAYFYQNLDVDKNLSAGIDIVANRSLYVKTGNYYIGSANNIVAAMGSDPNNMLIGNTTNNTYIRTSDANNLNVQDSTSNYRLLNQKNMQTLLNPIYVNKTGDTMSGKLTVSAPVSATFNGVTSANIDTPPTAASLGMWSVEITAPLIYNKLNGYLVPVYENHPDTGLPYVARYDEFKSSGTLSQFGDTLRTTYQIWQPRPNVTTDLHTANTMWIRQFNVAKNAWDGFGRMYSSNLPPTAADIGAISNDGSALNNLRIRDWIQIGNLRIYPDVASRSVKFDWID